MIAHDYLAAGPAKYIGYCSREKGSCKNLEGRKV